MGQRPGQVTSIRYTNGRSQDATHGKSLRYANENLSEISLHIYQNGPNPKH